MQDTMPKPKEKPAYEVRIGAIKAAIWKNDTTGGVRYNVTFSRIYKDKKTTSGRAPIRSGAMICWCWAKRSASA